ncbi:MAG: type II toxin-antitoxin system Phd/YefM family antitoxin [Anaerolineae bacterium]|nr:type II toxin-antitoxin system Phd/YefM family antitoxin [Anaerolineae bacterium]
MKKVIGATEIRNHMGRLLNRVHKGEEHLLIEKLGIPVAALISIKDYEEYQRLLSQHLLKDLGKKLGREAKRQGLTEEELRQEIKGTRREVFHERYGDLNS